MPIQIADMQPQVLLFSLLYAHIFETRTRTNKCVGMRGNGPGVLSVSKTQKGSPIPRPLCWLPIRNTICNSFSMMWSWASFGVVRNFTKEHLPRVGVSWITRVLVIFSAPLGDFSGHLNTFPKILRPTKNCFPHSSDSCSFCRGLFPSDDALFLRLSSSLLPAPEPKLPPAPGERRISGSPPRLSSVFEGEGLWAPVSGLPSAVSVCISLPFCGACLRQGSVLPSLSLERTGNALRL